MSESSSSPSLNKPTSQEELKQLMDQIIPIMPIATSVFTSLQSSLQNESSSFRQAFIQLVSASGDMSLIDMAVKMHEFFNLIEQVGVVWKKESGSSDGLKNLMKEKKRKTKKSSPVKEEKPTSPPRRSVAEVLDSLGMKIDQRPSTVITEAKEYETKSPIESEKELKNDVVTEQNLRKSMRKSRSERKSRSADVERSSASRISRLSIVKHPKAQISTINQDDRNSRISSTRKGSISYLDIPLSDSSVFRISCTFSPTIRDHISQNPNTYALYDRYTKIELRNVPPFEYVEPMANTEQDLSMLREFCRRGNGFSPATGVICFPICKNSGGSGIIVLVYFLYEAYIENLPFSSSPEVQYNGKIVIDLDCLQFGSLEEYPYLGSEYSHECMYWYWRPGIQAFFQKLNRKCDLYVLTRSSWDHLYHALIELNRLIFPSFIRFENAFSLDLSQSSKSLSMLFDSSRTKSENLWIIDSSRFNWERISQPRVYEMAKFEGDPDDTQLEVCSRFLDSYKVSLSMKR